jgi:hypothetical protein
MGDNWRDIQGRFEIGHGDTCGGKRTPEYRAWQAMRDRCHNSMHPRYAYYGARGITVCNEWADYPTGAPCHYKPDR